MAEVINLRHARKQKARVAKERLAAENRTAHGRSKAEKTTDARSRAKAAALLEGHRRGPADKDGAA